MVIEWVCGDSPNSEGLYHNIRSEGRATQSWTRGRGDSPFPIFLSPRLRVSASLRFDSPPPSDKMRAMTSYLPILVMGVLAAALPLGTIVLARAIQTRRANPAKLEPYECGVESPTTAFDTRFSVRYFLIAVLFVVFDVETIFLFPWAVMFNRLGLFGLIEMLIFLVILVIGYFYVWKRKALDWA